jgi:hypothetical protein
MSKSIIEDELDAKERELQRSIQQILKSAEDGMAHVRKLVDLGLSPIMYSDVPIQELTALCSLFRAAGDLKELRMKARSRRRRARSHR